MMQPTITTEIITTEDGSNSLHNSHWDVTFHSKYGAIQESQTIFINAGLAYQLERVKNGSYQLLEGNISILEMGLGSGLNAFMSYLHLAQHADIHGFYTAYEAYPLPAEQAIQLNYPETLSAEAERGGFEQIHQCPVDIWQPLGENFSLLKRYELFERLDTVDNYDLIYYDAFAPNAQPELWTEEMFVKLYQSMRSGAVLTTYCAKGAFKRMLKAIGFVVEALPGPKGKREMTRAMKP